jgi:hypothetical protein
MSCPSCWRRSLHGRGPDCAMQPASKPCSAARHGTPCHICAGTGLTPPTSCNRPATALDEQRRWHAHGRRAPDGAARVCGRAECAGVGGGERGYSSHLATPDRSPSRCTRRRGRRGGPWPLAASSAARATRRLRLAKPEPGRSPPQTLNLPVHSCVRVRVPVCAWVACESLNCPIRRHRGRDRMRCGAAGALRRPTNLRARGVEHVRLRALVPTMRFRGDRSRRNLAGAGRVPAQMWPIVRTERSPTTLPSTGSSCLRSWCRCGTGYAHP